MQVLKMEARIRNLYKEGSPSLCVVAHTLCISVFRLWVSPCFTLFFEFEVVGIFEERAWSVV